MTVDERLEKITGVLERLTERHTALTESVELLVRSTRRLARIVLHHEARLLDLEGYGEDENGAEQKP